MMYASKDFKKASVQKVIDGLDKKIAKLAAVAEGHKAHRDMLFEQLNLFDNPVEGKN